jgi:hypothetical protein
MIESLGGLKDCGHARSSMPAVGIHSSAIAWGMILDEGVSGTKDGLCVFVSATSLSFGGVVGFG